MVSGRQADVFADGLQGGESPFQGAVVRLQVQIAGKAVRMKTGARGLKSIMENLMLDVMYDVPSDKSIEKVVITGDCVLGKEKPVIIRRKTA